jgi:hypothetical protein
MTKAQRIIIQISWALGILSLVSGFVIKLLQLETRLTVAGRTAFILAGTFFLLALATRELRRE